MELSKLRYEDIKRYEISLEDSVHDSSYIKKQAVLFLSDSRKNVQSLGTKLLKKQEAYENELNRVKAMYRFDESFGSYDYIAGVDEVGRGPFAGPIAAAAVILKRETLNDEEFILNLNDSKKLSPEMREKISYEILNKALCVNIATLDNDIIDKKGIGFCNNEVLKSACLGLSVVPSLVISDGYKVKGLNINNVFVVKGDAKSASIAAASIVAKVYRDKIMKQFSKEYPQYGFEHNSGYGTKEHINAIETYGITKIHRKSFLKNLGCF